MSRFHIKTNAFLHLVFIAPETKQRKTSDCSQKEFALELDDDRKQEKEDVICSKMNNFIATYISDPFFYGLEVLFKPRQTLIKVMLCIQVVNCTLYWFTMEEQNMLYFYMSRKFAGFDGNDFAIYTITIKVSSRLLKKL